MPVSSIRVTEGSGPYLNTWQRSISSVNREDQYVQLGEPALPTFSAHYFPTTTTTGEHILELMAGASVYLRILRIAAYANDWPAAAALMELDIRRLDTAGSGGTAQIPVPFDTADTSSATVQWSVPTPGIEGAWIGRLAVPMGTAASASDRTVVWTPEPRGKPLIIPAGTANGLMLEPVLGVASSGLFVEVIWTETAWL